MPRPKLSICIPTRNRGKHLERTILSIFNGMVFPFEIEVCVCDNKSDDDTPDIVGKLIESGYKIKYRRNELGVNMWTNHHNALSMGTGEYLFATSDDDRIISENLINVIDFLDKNGRFIAAFAPIEYYDERTGLSTGTSYLMDELPDITVLSGDDPFELLKFFIINTVPPELFVFRSSAAIMAFSNTTFCYSCYFDFSNIISLGDVAFFKQPFYRWVKNSLADESGKRSHAGAGESIAGWSNWRGGIEELMHTLLQRKKLTITPDIRIKYIDCLNFFEARRMAVTLSACLAAHDYLKAYEVYIRMLSFCELNNVSHEFKPVATAKGVLPEIIPWAYLRHLVKLEQKCDRIYLVHVEIPDDSMEFLSGGNSDIEVIYVKDYSSIDFSSIAHPEYTRILVVPSRRDRDFLLATTDYPPGQLIDVESLILRFPMRC